MDFINDFDFLSFMNIGNAKEQQNENLKEEANLYTTTEGFIKGNMFKDEYIPFKDYKPKMPKTCSEKNAKLYKIMELMFCANDLNLYLDLHNDDALMFDKFKECTCALLKLEEEYIKMYGPIEITDNLGDTNTWTSNMPWESEDSLYV